MTMEDPEHCMDPVAKVRQRRQLPPISKKVLLGEKYCRIVSYAIVEFSLKSPPMQQTLLHLFYQITPNTSTCCSHHPEAIVVIKMRPSPAKRLQLAEGVGVQ